MTFNIPPDLDQIGFDLIIIGAGISGAGVARDAAMRGLKVLLLDKSDICGGTSAWSTRLIHGGLRYLEHGELGLVRESLREREVLLSIAPHLVKPLPMLIPIYRRSRRGPLTIRAGMIGYDLLSLDKSLPRHQMLAPEAAQHIAPGLEMSGLRGAAIYYDAQVPFAERLVWENALSAKGHGATVLTYATVNRFIMSDGILRGVEFVDARRGHNHSARGRVVINATGAWVDQVLANTHLESRQLIGGTKGSHIVVAPFRGAPETAVYVEAQTDQRPFFIIPWNGNYLIGTTDTRYQGNLDVIEINEEEIDYLLGETNRLIPTAHLQRQSILFSYSGVRPLAFSKHAKEQGITRRHFVSEHPSLSNLLSTVGVKLTTYRSMAEQVVNLVLSKLGRKDPGCSTARLALPGADTDGFSAFCNDFKAGNSLPAATNERLLSIYGTRAAKVVQLATADPTLAAVFHQESGAIAAEVVFSFEHELAETLTDCLLRRTMLGLNSSCGLNVVEAAAAVASKHLGWSEARVAEEVSRYRKSIERFLPRPRN